MRKHLRSIFPRCNGARNPTLPLRRKRPALFGHLDVCCDVPTHVEIKRAVQKFAGGKAHGTDGIPAEFWKTVYSCDGPGARWLTEFVQMCWRGKKMPDDWHMARIALIFKKGDVQDCGNYRPISLLNFAYKVYARILLNRLKRAGAESRLWSSQYGFRSGRSTTHALC